MLLLYMNTFKDVLPIFKSFVLAFEQKTPQIHKLHDAIIDTIQTFLCYFSKYEKVRSLRPKQYRLFDVEGCVKKAQSMFVGGTNHIFIAELKERKLNDIVVDYYAVLKVAYVTAAKYILNKFPTDNELLITVAFSVGQSKTQRLLTKLESFFPTIVTVGKKQSYLEEVNNILLDKTLPKAVTDDGNVRLDKWWSVVFKNGKYPVLSSVIKACLSIFSGPQVESSFSMMNDIINKKSGRMLVETYSAIIGTKYNLLASGKTSFALFHRKNIFRDPVNARRNYFIRTSCSRYKRRLKTAQNEVAAKQQKILSQTQIQTIQRSETNVAAKKRPLGKQKNRHEKVHEKAKRIKIDAVKQAKEASRLTPKSTSIDNSRDADTVDFTSVASAGSSKESGKFVDFNEKKPVKKKLNRWKDMDLKHFFKK